MHLTRKPGEKILIILKDGTRVVITYCEHRGSTVRVTIKAPPEILVLREELEVLGEDVLVKESGSRDRQNPSLG